VGSASCGTIATPRKAVLIGMRLHTGDLDAIEAWVHGDQVERVEGKVTA
jgi:hypothetical protein